MMISAIVVAGRHILSHRVRQGFLPSLQRHERRIFQRHSLISTTRTTSTSNDPFPKHELNCAKALVKAEESKLFSEIVQLPVTALQGIGPVHSEQLEKLRIRTVSDLASYKYYHIARSLVTLANEEEVGGRLKHSHMNVNKAVDKAWETARFQDIIEQPVSALQGLNDAAANTWKQLGVSTVGDLAQFKYCKWAQAMLVLSKYEETPKET